MRKLLAMEEKFLRKISHLEAHEKSIVKE